MSHRTLQPASSRASRNDLVRSNASKIFMISPADFAVSLLRWWVPRHRDPPGSLDSLTETGVHNHDPSRGPLRRRCSDQTAE
jgi:hypothetical protein